MFGDGRQPRINHITATAMTRPKNSPAGTCGKDTGVFVALRDLRFARGRFALMGAVVALITMLVVLLSGLTAGLGRGNTSAITDLPADHLVFSAPTDGAKLTFTESSISPAVQQMWANVAGVQSAQPIAISMSRAAVDQRTSGVAVFAVTPGSSLAPDVAPGQVVLSTKAADTLDVTTGARITLAGHALTVAAVTGSDEYSHAPVIWTTTTDAPTSGRQPGDATILALTTTGADSRELTAADARLATVTLTPGDSLAAIGSYTSENGSLQLMRVLLFAISALVIGAFFTVWTVQRTGDIAILKAVGASTRYLLIDALGQALALLVTGTALGTAVAAGLGSLVTALGGGAVPFVLDLSTVLVPAALMVALGLAGAAASLRSITHVDPLTALGSAR
jgi:putative ABC transport system permease protein